MLLVDIRNLTIELKTEQGVFKVVDRFSMKLKSGNFMGLVGESGSGKSLIAKFIAGIPNLNWIVSVDRFYFNGVDMLKLSEKKRRKKMSPFIAMIFQEAKGYFDPTMKIGKYLKLAISYHSFKGHWWQFYAWRKKRIAELLHRVGIKNHKAILHAFPEDLSEGECQKIMIALALANKPQLLIADEPTNAMESMMATQIFRLISGLNQNADMTILLISHDLNRVLEWCDQVQVLYCGEVAESAEVEALKQAVYHPYTYSLMTSNPNKDGKLAHKSYLNTLLGNIPALNHLPVGCKLGPRCGYAQRACMIKPELIEVRDHLVACHFPLNVEADEY